jgi:RNA polymerase sigma-70 factor (ECF subfamily)
MNTQEQNAAFEQAAVRCRAAMYRVARGMLRSDADAEDAVSNAVVAAYTHLGSLRDPRALPGYLMRCTQHACHAILRRRKREACAEDMSVYGQSAENPGSVWSYVHHLPEKYRMPLLLRYGEDWPLADIAQALRLPKGTVSARLSRGLKMLRKELQEEENP